MEIDRGIISPGYFQTLRTPLVAGRGFTDHDNAKSQPVAIVNQEFCQRYWPGQDAIGKKIMMWYLQQTAEKVWIYLRSTTRILLSLML